MKSKAIFIVSVIVIIIMFTGCSNLSRVSSDKNVLKKTVQQGNDTEAIDKGKVDKSNEPEAICKNINFRDTDMFALAYLGYRDSSSITYYEEKYLNTDNIDTIDISSEEHYLIIPREPNMKVEVYKESMEADPELIKKFDVAKPFIVCCNISDIFPDCKIVITSSDGNKSIEFSPYISLKDGSVQIGDNGIDITKAE